MKSSSREKFLQTLSENIMKTLLASIHSENCSDRIETFFRFPWKQRILWYWCSTFSDPPLLKSRYQLNWKIFPSGDNKFNRDVLEQYKKQETYHQFSDHVKETILNLTVLAINKIIENKVKQISMVITKKYQWLWY